MTFLQVSVPPPLDLSRNVGGLYLSKELEDFSGKVSGGPAGLAAGRKRGGRSGG
jgi:hypothetical protein